MTSAFSGITDLATVFQRLGGAGSSAVKQDWGGVAANLLAAGGKAAIYASKQNATLVKALKESGTKVLPTPTAIIDAMMLAAFVVDLLNGFGPPDSGAAFKTGADKLDNTEAQLEAAVPDSRDWSGEAAQAYIDHNAALQALVQTMKELDNQMAALMKNQADQVQQAHTTITWTVFSLTAAQGVALALYLIPVVGPEISCAFQIVAAFAAGAAILVMEMLTLSNSMSISNEVTTTALQYVEVGKSAVKPGTFAKIEVAGTEETRVSSFTAISDSMSGASALSAPPTVQSLASIAGDSASPEQRAVLSSLADDAAGAPTEVPATATPEAPATADTSAAAATPAYSFAPPSVNQITSTASRLSGSASQQMNLVNQTMGSVQQLAQMGQGAAVPAEGAVAEEAAPAEATLADDVEGAGAASSQAGAERAPIDDALVAEAGAEAERSGRVL